MPSVRYSRDKRGYNHVYLVETPQARGKRVRPRLLYWFRTPPGVKVGREPFDDAVQRALEAQNPHLTFDWRTLKATPMPSVEIDWRERRRAAKQAKAERAREVEVGEVEGSEETTEETAEAETFSGLGPETLEETVIAGEPSVGPGSLPERRTEDAPARRRRRRRRLPRAT